MHMMIPTGAHRPSCAEPPPLSACLEHLSQHPSLLLAVTRLLNMPFFEQALSFKDLRDMFWGTRSVVRLLCVSREHD